MHPRPVGAPKKGCTWDGIQGAWVRIGDDYVCAYTHGRARACVCVRGLMCDVYVFFSPGSLSACLYTCHTNRWPTVSKEEETSGTCAKGELPSLLLAILIFGLVLAVPGVVVASILT